MKDQLVIGKPSLQLLITKMVLIKGEKCIEPNVSLYLEAQN